MTEVGTQKGEVQVNRYDAEGLRHGMEENGRLLQFLYKGKKVVAEEEKVGIVRYICGLGLVSSDSEEARTYYHYASDELGSITHIVKVAFYKKLEEGRQAGDRFGGSPELDNLVSQSQNVNLSLYKKIENEWAKAIGEGKKVTVNVDIIYDGNRN